MTTNADTDLAPSPGRETRPRAAPRVAAALFAIVMTATGGAWLWYSAAVTGWACPYGSASHLCGGGAGLLAEGTLVGGVACILANIALACAARARSRAWWWIWWIANGLTIVAWGIAEYVVMR